MGQKRCFIYFAFSQTQLVEGKIAVLQQCFCIIRKNPQCPFWKLQNLSNLLNHVTIENGSIYFAISQQPKHCWCCMAMR